MPRARNSKASICRECKKRLLENKLWEKGHTRLRKHAEKDKKKGKGRRVGSSSGRRIENDANACLDQFCRNVKSFKNRSSRTSAPHLGHIWRDGTTQAGQGSAIDASPLAANFRPGLHHRSSRSRWEDSHAITSPQGQVAWSTVRLTESTTRLSAIV